MECHSGGCFEWVCCHSIILLMPTSATNLFMLSLRLQVRILKRACQLLKVGGRLVYSTCSLNPLENECVVAIILREFPGAFELVDVSTSLPALRRSPGMTHWKIIDKKGTTLTSRNDLTPEHRGYLYPSMFSPSKEDAEKMGLEKWWAVSLMALSFLGILTLIFVFQSSDPPSSPKHRGFLCGSVAQEGSHCWC